MPHTNSQSCCHLPSLLVQLPSVRGVIAATAIPILLGVATDTMIIAYILAIATTADLSYAFCYDYHNASTTTTTTMSMSQACLLLSTIILIVPLTNCSCSCSCIPCVNPLVSYYQLSASNFRLKMCCITP